MLSYVIDGGPMLSFRLVNAFALCTFCRRCDICSCEELMSYAVLPSLWGLAYNLERPYMVDHFFGRVFWIAQVRGWDCHWWCYSLPLGPNGRRGLLLLQLASASICRLHMGDDASSAIRHSISPKKIDQNLEASTSAYGPCWVFAFSRYSMQGSLPRLQFRHNHGRSHCKVEI